MRVLLTGAAGSIGRVLVDGLSGGGHDVVGLDLVERPDALDNPWYAVDCTDPAAVDVVVGEVRPEAIVHLAGIPTESSLPDALASHVVTTGALLDAMVRHDCRRIVYASSNHAVGRTPSVKLLGTDVRPRPDTFYGVAKVAAEGLLSLYADRHGIDAIACRIGSFDERPTARRALSTWLSHTDAVRMVHAALTTPSPGYAVLYGVSANTRGWWDLGPGRALGYHPRDDAEQYADDVPAGEHDDADAARVGGPFATAQFERPAF